MNQEEAFIQQIQKEPDNPEHRLVYADYLEDQGDDRARMLRLEAALMTARTKKKREAIRGQLATERRKHSAPWLAAIDSTEIANCRRALQMATEVEFELECPQRWERLTLTGVDTIRHCDECRTDVHYCGTVEEARYHARQGHCVAVDSRSTERPNRGHLIPGPRYGARRMGRMLPHQTLPDWWQQGQKVTVIGGAHVQQQGAILAVHQNDRTATVSLGDNENELLVEIELYQLQPLPQE